MNVQVSVGTHIRGAWIPVLSFRAALSSGGVLVYQLALLCRHERGLLLRKGMKSFLRAA
jgi:hypothetical protein